ncbi:MAG: hypothetical protein NHF89_00705 [Candidatus Shikimatogenerans bostrichidophilus]|nr:MAG: hypothetical protein NHF89_00705 [Candidatus Shikimatogenerans bostrichidophilus]
MTYILNIYENNKYILSNISYNGKLLFKIKKNSNSLHQKIKKSLIKYKFKINKINAICVNFGPSISYTRIRIILSSAKGLCLSLKKPLIMINDFLILINNKLKLIKKYKKINFIIYSYNKKKIYIIKYNCNKNIFYKKKKIKKYNFIKNIYFLNIKFKKKNYKYHKNIYFYKINYNDIIKLSYEFYKKKKFVKNINCCEPIYI